jgi:hypothetical protein
MLDDRHYPVLAKATNRRKPAHIQMVNLHHATITRPLARARYYHRRLQAESSPWHEVKSPPELVY